MAEGFFVQTENKDTVTVLVVVVVVVACSMLRADRLVLFAVLWVLI